ncbi:hypothetical protein EVAR_101789_1 [Eumeta japonica]|uniref:Uncharacterized protein n=1 Tax=Eumeta variegata TaxID=151549 RepID=A0A4C1SQE0_EUMVA|nr:hypothetical protein EVAR_101789_1 [Eumeta japonica]
METKSKPERATKLSVGTRTETKNKASSKSSVGQRSKCDRDGIRNYTRIRIGVTEIMISPNLGCAIEIERKQPTNAAARDECCGDAAVGDEARNFHGRAVVLFRTVFNVSHLRSLFHSNDRKRDRYVTTRTLRTPLYRLSRALARTLGSGRTLHAAAVSLLLRRIGRWSGREIDASQAERLSRSSLSIVPRSHLYARLRRNATMSHTFSSPFVAPAHKYHDGTAIAQLNHIRGNVRPAVTVAMVVDRISVSTVLEEKQLQP